MKTRFKDVPWGVMGSLVFLLTVYVTVCVMIPIVGLFFTAGFGTFLSIIRVIHYLNHGN